MFTIPIQENSGKELPAVEVGRASAFRARIVGVESDYANVQIAFGTPQDAASNAVACNARPGGDWTCYASGAYFMYEGRAHYHVTAKTPQGDSVYLGGGTLFISPSVLNVDDASVPVIPPNCYVRGSNGLYYLVTAELDDDGIPYMIVDRNGVTM